MADETRFIADEALDAKTVFDPVAAAAGWLDSDWSEVEVVVGGGEGKPWYYYNQMMQA